MCPLHARTSAGCSTFNLCLLLWVHCQIPNIFSRRVLLPPPSATCTCKDLLPQQTGHSYDLLQELEESLFTAVNFTKKIVVHVCVIPCRARCNSSYNKAIYCKYWTDLSHKHKPILK